MKNGFLAFKTVYGIKVLKAWYDGREQKSSSRAERDRTKGQGSEDYQSDSEVGASQ
jgi:hypothetical protein